MLEACNKKKVAVRILTCFAINLFVSVITDMKMELMILRSLAGARRDLFYMCSFQRGKESFLSRIYLLPQVHSQRFI